MKTCVVIGAGPGLGMAVARKFGQQGLAVALVSRNADKLERAAAELRTQGLTATAHPTDVANLDSLQATLARIQQEQGPVQVVIYNAAAYTPGLPSELRPTQFRQDFDVSVVGALVAAQQVLPAMRAAGEGTLLFTGGGAADHPTAAYTTLSFGKVGIRLLATLLHEELRETPILVATITIKGPMREGTHFDPARIAEVFWQAHHQGQQSSAERVYQ